MKNKILKIMLGGATIAMIFMMKYIPSASRAIRKLDFNDQKEKKKRSYQTNGNDDPYASNLQWKKIGKVSNLFIYPVKSSDMPVIPSSDSYDFFDYGMCEKYKETYFYDGMFIVYNKTKDKFEDARTYYLLENMAVNKTNQTENAEVTLRSEDENNTINLNIHHNRYSTINSTNSFLKQIWSNDIGKFYGSNEQVNTWVKDIIEARFINQDDEDIIFTQIIPNDFYSTQWIKDNWDRFVQGYKNYEEDDTGKLITLPRFVLMTVQTCMKLSEINAQIAPNVVIDTDELNPFEEKYWNWIKIGENVVLRKVKPVPSNLHEEIQHRGIYCGLWIGGRVSNNDDVFIDISNDEKPFKLPRN